jgi:hypothetical protein
MVQGSSGRVFGRRFLQKLSHLIDIVTRAQIYKGSSSIPGAELEGV